MKTGAFHSDGSGFIYRGSLKYAYPLSEKYYTSSPYAYCAGDPVNLVDPDGRDPIYAINFWGKPVKIGDDGKEFGNS